MAQQSPVSAVCELAPKPCIKESVWLFCNFEMHMAFNLGGFGVLLSAIDLARALECKDPEQSVNVEIGESERIMFKHIDSSWNENLFTTHPDTIMITLPTAIKFIFNSLKPQSPLLLSWLCGEIVSALLLNIALCPSDSFFGENVSFLYVFTTKLYCAQDIYQIGCCRNVQDRLILANECRVNDLLYAHAIYQVNNAEEIEISLHHAFKSKRIRADFYTLDKSNLATIQSICAVVQKTVTKICSTKQLHHLDALTFVRK